MGRTKHAASCPSGVPAPVNVGELGKKRRLGQQAIERALGRSDIAAMLCFRLGDGARHAVKHFFRRLNRLAIRPFAQIPLGQNSARIFGKLNRRCLLARNRLESNPTLHLLQMGSDGQTTPGLQTRGGVLMAWLQKTKLHVTSITVPQRHTLQAGVVGGRSISALGFGQSLDAQTRRRPAPDTQSHTGYMRPDPVP